MKPDKILHFLAGFFIVMMAGPSLLLSVFLLAFGAIGKECYDEYSYGGYDWLDTLATALGGVVGIITKILLYL